jgi:hypothetical protein
MGNGVGTMFHSTAKISILPVIIKQESKCFILFFMSHMPASLFGKKGPEATRIGYGLWKH